MGMPVRMVLHAPGRDAGERAARAAFARIAALDAMLSDYRADSELARLSTSSGTWVTVSPELFTVLTTALDIARASDGAFDPTAGPLTHLWREGRRAGGLPSPADVTEARTRVGWRLVELDSARRAVRLTRTGMQLDLGGIAKGFILREALIVLTAHDAGAALIAAGGDVLVGAAPPGRAGWQIAAPYAGAAFQARASSLTHAALATSGPIAQFIASGGARHSHVIDPRTGLSVTSDRVVGVIAADAMLADALATALGVLGPEAGTALLDRVGPVEVSWSPMQLRCCPDGLQGADARNRRLRPLGLRTVAPVPLDMCRVGTGNPRSLRRGYIRRPRVAPTSAIGAAPQLHRSTGNC